MLGQGSDRKSHRLLIDGRVVDAQEFFLVEDHLLAGHAHDVVHRGQFDRVDRTGLFAHAAVDAAELIQVELDRVLLAVVPGRLFALDVDAVGGAGGRAHHAGDAADPAVLVSVEAVDAAEVAGVEAAVFDGLVLAPFFGVLEGFEPLAAAGPLADGAGHVLERGSQALEDLGEVERLGRVEGLLVDVDDVRFVDGHGDIIRMSNRARSVSE